MSIIGLLSIPYLRSHLRLNKYLNCTGDSWRDFFRCCVVILKTTPIVSASNNIMSVRSTFGALLVGAFVAAVLTGIVIAQGVLYLKSNTDSTYIRTMVGVILLLDILHSITICMGLWTWFISLQEAQSSVFVIPISISISVVLTALTTIIAHAFFAWRIFKLSKKNYLLILPIAIPAFLAFIFSCISEVEMVNLRSFPHFRARYSWPFSAALAVSASVDVLITVMMMILLRQHRARSLSLNAVIDSLFMHTLENGAITSLAAIICMIFWLTMKNFVFLGMYFIIDKLYGNSILAVLNYRKRLTRTRDSFPRPGQGNVVDLDVVRFSGTHGPPCPVRASFRSSSSRSILKFPAQICNNGLMDRRTYRAPSSEQVFQISVERSVELQTDDCVVLSRERLGSSASIEVDSSERRVFVE
ncbi:hypothetical protein J3R30DRAFT_827703 [Lentinula aciculospora]|uniref:DUF6534 domain-containing protein n=1 Tax=Lentinula aciculospora TaxID=153920 RepID=A0A9W9DUY8_9AGAR|nr:hypothetical protein J3R30DRAFT_827703 [Lentinula aciculospora]